MQVSITNVSEVQQEADIQLTQDEIQPMFEQAYVKYRPKVEIKGFRKGKVPMPMIKQLYGEAIEQDALDDIASDFYRRAMEEKDIHPVGQPTMVDMDFKRGDHFHFKIKYEVKPGITLGSYRGIKVEKPIHIVTDAEVDTEIGKIRRANSTTADVETVTDTGHIVTADVQELDETGAPLIGKKTPGARFDLTDETLATEICDALAAAATGQTYRTKFESQHGDHSHTMHIALTVTKVEKVILPAFDDALVAKITGGKTTTVGEFRKNLRSDIERYWEEESTARLNDNIAKSLVASHPFPIPDSIVNGLLDSYVDDVRNRSRDRKLPKGFDEQKFREENRASATWQAQWLLLSGRIAEEEKITVTEDEIASMAEREAGKIGIEKERLLEYYRKSSSASNRILSDKLMAFLRSNAKITEKVIDDAPRQP
ncbi:MAG TPA: trigger factor [Bacteroidota bacterium]|nr:trigger factor [Bacteroidota bacterium]